LEILRFFFKKYEGEGYSVLAGVAIFITLADLIVNWCALLLRIPHPEFHPQHAKLATQVRRQYG